MSKGFLMRTVSIAVAIFLMFFTACGGKKGGNTPDNTVSVPNVVGRTQTEAQNAITSAGLTPTVTQASHATIPVGSVISQAPAPGTSVIRGSSVNLVISLGPANVSVPSVVGWSQSEAETAITSVGLTVGSVTELNSTAVAIGNVISQTPVSGTSVAAGTAVNLVISLGPANVNVPNVVGKPLSEAETEITTAGLTVGSVTQQNSAVFAIGYVISQTPIPDALVEAGEAVNLVISLGASVPDVEGMPQSEAEAAIKSAGLTVTITTQPNAAVTIGYVISQTPVSGTSVEPGTTVNLVISSGASVPNVVGMPQSEAEAAITTAGLTVGSVTEQNSATFAIGYVISQTPEPGESAVAGTAVNLVISLGASVPDVEGMPQSEAEAAIKSAGLTVTITAQVNTAVAIGYVISQTPDPGTSVEPGTAVNLVISSGTSVPDVVGMPQSEAEAAITTAGLTVGSVTEQHNTTVPAGNVISQTPEPGESVVAGTAVNLVISSGVSVPDVVGMPQSDAEAAIITAGLTVGSITEQHNTTVPTGNVISQTPLANLTVELGTAVNLVISLGPDYENIDTYAYGVNKDGLIVGEFKDDDGKRKAFLKDGDDYIQIAPPDAVGDVYVFGINDSGDILLFNDNCYYLLKDGTYEPLENHPDPDVHLTYYTGISNSGLFAGYYEYIDGYAVGFIKDGDEFIDIVHPDAYDRCDSDWPCGTWVTGINKDGDITGAYIDSEGYFHGFIYTGGVYHTIDHPGISGMINVNTYVSGINDSGQAAGYFWNDEYTCGFVYEGGSFIREVIEHEGAAPSGSGTYVLGISNSGQLVGWYDDGGQARNFVMDF